MKLTDKEIKEILEIKLELYDSVATIEPAKLMKYIDNEKFNTTEKVQDIQEFHLNGVKSSLNQILQVCWFSMAADEFMNRKFECDIAYAKKIGHTYIDEDRQTIELKNGEVLDLSDIDQCDFNFIIDQLRE